MTIIITKREEWTQPLDVSPALAEAWQSREPSDWSAITMSSAGRSCRLGEAFQIERQAADHSSAPDVIWRGRLSNVAGIGAGLSRGRVRIEGDCGDRVGAAMTDGHIDVTGSAADLAGAAMRGGRLVVQGDVGDQVGGPLDEATPGMRGGELVVAGSAGHGAGHRLRRGLLIIQGDARDLAGYEMLAGSLIIGGSCGRRAGAEMRRGSIVLASDRVEPLATFVCAGRIVSPIIEILAGHVARLAPRLAAIMRHRTWRLFSGDLLRGGRGEILCADGP